MKEFKKKSIRWLSGHVVCSHAVPSICAILVGILLQLPLSAQDSHDLTPIPQADYERQEAYSKLPEVLNGTWKSGFTGIKDLAFYQHINLNTDEYSFYLFSPFIIDILKSKGAYTTDLTSTKPALPYGFKLNISDLVSSKLTYSKQLVLKEKSLQINFGMKDFDPKHQVDRPVKIDDKSPKKSSLLIPQLPIKDGFIKISFFKKSPTISYYIIVDKKALLQKGVKRGNLGHIEDYYEAMRIPLVRGVNPPEWIHGHWETDISLRRQLRITSENIEFLYQDKYHPLSHFYNFMSFKEDIGGDKYIYADRQIYLEIGKDLRYYFIDKFNKNEVSGKMFESVVIE